MADAPIVRQRAEGPPKWLPRVLIVDDDLLVRQALAQILELRLRGVEVVDAMDGPSALGVMASHPVDVLVTDYQMPGMDGLQLLRKARERQPRLVCLMLTASQELPVAKKAINEAHVHSFLTKPVDAREVVAQVADALVVALQQRVRDALSDAQGEALREALALVQAQAKAK